MAAPGNRFDVIIVGGGPAGVFAALELARSSDVRVLLLEKGKDISARNCPQRTTGYCAHCSDCDITSGWGGAGAFSDGKLTLASQVGGWLGDYLESEHLDLLIADVDSIYRELGAPNILFGDDAAVYERWRDLAAKQGLHLVRSPVRHLGTERAAGVMAAVRGELEGRVQVRTGIAVTHILTNAGGVTGVETATGEIYESATVVVAPGRDGSTWLTAEAARLGISLSNNPVDIGVRVEVPAAVTEAIAAELYEPKLVFTSGHFEDQVRTFCVNPRGEVCTECWGDAVTVNGHSYADADRKTENTNFALLVSTNFTEPFKEPIEYGKSIARLANMLGKDILIQRLGDLRSGHRTTPEGLRRSVVQPTLRAATPGDLSFALPYRHLRDILDMLEALDGLIPGVGDCDTLLYGAEVKFYSSRLEVDRDMQTPIAGLFAIGDGAGITRGLVQASASGLVAARAALRLV